ncbi:glycosyltransferase family 4 protein [Anaeromyxobacter sp. Fw109-5]|uniref:glycosyltransferase family 4 protein n=1 Tax=Anaeromyxobacter sp. (strain Fw109-5) TaxID=404589 RepID=UPI0003224799|nr:glycosyltransferase family 4 protein [Anaeromyxobacter sp. Fw109-5]
MPDTEPKPKARRGRVAYLMSWFPAPTETFILHELLELRRQGLDIDVYPLLGAAPGPRHPGAEEMVARTRYHRGLSGEVVAAQLHWLRRRPIAYLRAWARALRGNLRSPGFLARAAVVVPRAAFIAREVEAGGHAHVHAHWATHPALAALVVKELTGTGYSFTAHAHDLYLDRAMLDEKVREARFVVTISEYNRAFLRDLYGEEAAAKTTVIRCGVDPTRFQPRPQPVRQGPPIIACVAGLRDYKGHRHLLDACALLRDRGVAFRCVLVGDGPERAALQRQLAALQLEQVELLGAMPQDKVRELLGAADVVVHPSVVTGAGMMDGIPVALMEAMAMACPVVSTRVSGIPELVRDGKTGLLVEQRDAAGLADAIQRLVEDPALARRLALAGRRAVLREFTLERNGALLLERFSEFIGGGSARSARRRNGAGGARAQPIPLAPRSGARAEPKRPRTLTPGA